MVQEVAAVRSLSVAAGPAKRSRDGSSTLFASPSPLQVKSRDGAYARTEDTGESGAGGDSEGDLGVAEVGWQSLGEVRDMVSTRTLAADGDGGRALVRVKGVCSGALKFYKSDFAVATVVRTKKYSCHTFSSSGFHTCTIFSLHGCRDVCVCDACETWMRIRPGS